MCRSIKPLRNMDHPVTEQEIYEAALQYVRKVSGYRKPSKANEEAFNKAIEEVANSTRKILANLKTVEGAVLRSSKGHKSKVSA
ncbi:MAG: DUF2277 domain-containing protein [Chloroflexi bacterium]|nr:DUF2277 domain-containing protein [Chloroflexota bacterium]